MASRPCCVWFMTHLTRALVKPQFISLGPFLISYSTICLTAQSAPRGKPWQSHLPAHASRRRRRRWAADTVSQPKECMEQPTAQSLASETSCTLTQSPQVPAVRQGRTEQPQWTEGSRRATARESLSQHWWRSTLSASQIHQHSNLL